MRQLGVDCSSRFHLNFKILAALQIPSKPRDSRSLLLQPDTDQRVEDKVGQGVGSVIGNHAHCDLRHKRQAVVDKKTEIFKSTDLMAAENPHCVDYFTWIDIVAWTILAMLR